MGSFMKTQILPNVCNCALSACGFRPMGVQMGNNEGRRHLHSPGGAIVPAGCRSSSVVALRKALCIPAVIPSLLLSKEA